MSQIYASSVKYAASVMLHVCVCAEQVIVKDITRVPRLLQINSYSEQWLVLLWHNLHPVIFLAQNSWLCCCKLIACTVHEIAHIPSIFSPFIPTIPPFIIVLKRINLHGFFVCFGIYIFSLTFFSLTSFLLTTVKK